MTVQCHSNPHHRNGLSLLEVIVALAILAGSAAVLGQMVQLAVSHSERALAISEAQTVAQNVMSELLLGERPWEASPTFQPVDLWSHWDCRIEMESVGLKQLTAVRVTVVERAEEAVGDAVLPESPTPALPTMTGEADGFGGRSHYHLTRWVRRASPTEQSFESQPPYPTDTSMTGAGP